MRIYQRGRVWYIDYSFNGRRVQKKVSTSKKIAELALKKIEVMIAENKFLDVVEKTKMTFDELSKQCLKFSKANNRPQVYRRYKIFTDNLLKVFSGKDIKDISAYDLEQYKVQRKHEVSEATVNRELTYIKSMFNKAIEWHYLKHNQLQAVRKFRESPGRLRYLNEEEIEKLINSCADHLRPIVIMALNTGMRKGEILNLLWSDVDMKKGTLTIKKTKNNEMRMVPINESLHNVLQSLKKGNHSQPVFVNENGKPFVEIKRSFATALRKARITDFRFHDLRHTFASRLVMAGVDIRTVQELMGHKDIRMTARYSHLSDAHLREAVNKVVTNLGQTENTKSVKRRKALKNKEPASGFEPETCGLRNRCSAN